MRDKLPPHAPDAERAIIGCILSDPGMTMADLAEAFPEPSVFYTPGPREAYTASLAMQGRQQSIDLITLGQALVDAGSAITRADLAEWQDSVPSPTMLPQYIATVRHKWWLRNIIQTASGVIAGAYDAPEDAEQFLDDAQARMLGIDRNHGGRVWDARALVLKTADAIEHCIKALGVVEMPTGFSYFDRLVGGLHRKEMIVIAGRPSTGKTSLAMNIAERMSIEGRKAIGVISLEMSAQDLMMRMICSRGRVNMHKLRTGFVSEADKPKLNVAGAKIAKESRLYIDDTPRMTALQIRSRLRQLKAVHGISAAIIDYMQLIQSPRGMEENRVQALAEISGSLKAAAKELDIPIVVLSQLSRDSEKRGGRPRMSDLRDSGAIEQDADLIGILWREPMSEEEDQQFRQQIKDDPHANTEYNVIMEVCKNRNGPTGEVFFKFMRWCMRFEDLQRPSKPDQPDPPDLDEDVL